MVAIRTWIIPFIEIALTFGRWRSNSRTKTYEFNTFQIMVSSDVKPIISRGLTHHVSIDLNYVLSYKSFISLGTKTIPLYDIVVDSFLSFFSRHVPSQPKRSLFDWKTYFPTDPEPSLHNGYVMVEASK